MSFIPQEKRIGDRLKSMSTKPKDMVRSSQQLRYIAELMKRFIVSAFLGVALNVGLAGVGCAQQSVKPAVSSPEPNLQLPVVNDRPSVSTTGIQAERSVAVASTDIAYWLNEQRKLEVENARLQTQLTDLRKQIDESSQKELIEKIRACEEFIAEISRLQSVSGKFINPALVQTLTWVQHSAAEHGRALQEDLARQRGEGPDLAALTRQVDETQEALKLNTQLEGAISSTIANLRSDRERQSKVQELNDVLQGDATPKVAIPDKTKP